MMELLSALVRYGVSTTVAGATSSGKTTLTGWLLTTIPYDKRILRIESGSRELDLVVRDENDKILNKVVHTITRESEDDKNPFHRTICWIWLFVSTPIILWSAK